MRQSRRMMTTANGKIDERSFDFTGRYNFNDEGNGQWNIEFLESGTLTFNRSVNVDAWCVGGGGGGAPSGVVGNNHAAGGGGGGGYVAMGTSLRVVASTQYPVVVGEGGERGYVTTGWPSIITGQDGEPSSFMNVTANGGQGGATIHKDYTGRKNFGGNGGNGGGGYGPGGDDTYGGNGGSDGNNGTGGAPGSGSGVLTRDFYMMSGTQRSGGGGGGNYGHWNDHEIQGAGGAGGGGNARKAIWVDDSKWVNAYDGVANTGGGGGGGATVDYTRETFYCNGGNGGSGIVILRSHRVANSLKYTYSGDADYIQEDDYNWHVDITSGGTLTITEEATVDIYLLGGGQSGYIGSHWGSGTDYYAGGAGGQGGYTNILHDVTLQPGTYTLTIGQGGVGGQDRNGIAGESTIFGGIDNGTAPGGGSGASAPEGGTIKAGAAGGIAGSGNSSWTPHGGKPGGDSEVYDFTGINRGGGGGGGRSAKDTHSTGSGGSTSGGNVTSTGSSSGAEYNDGGVGGAQGGGDQWHAAVANYGGGGNGGGGAYYRETQSGSSGFIQLRNARE